LSYLSTPFRRMNPSLGAHKRKNDAMVKQKAAPYRRDGSDYTTLIKII